MTTYEHPCKCMNCSLHFVALSWSENWGFEVPGDAPVCPQCGSDALIRWAPRGVDKEIFEIVPGQQALVGMPTTT